MSTRLVRDLRLSDEDSTLMSKGLRRKVCSSYIFIQIQLLNRTIYIYIIQKLSGIQLSEFSSSIRFMSSYVCPVLVSVLAISATLVVTMAILHWNYVENNKRKVSKKMIILNHWGKQKPVESDLEKLYVEELLDNKLQRSAKNGI